MNDYKAYMDRVAVSDELHHKLLGLESEKKEGTPVKWKKYAAVAACAALLVGVGVWGAGRLIEWNSTSWAVSPDPGPAQSAAPPAPSTSEAIDLAPEDPSGALPGIKIIGGYETRENRAGVDVVVYHVLPWIDYGAENEAAAVSLDWDIPQNATRRDLSTDEITALLGGTDAVDLHLDWSAYELTGWAAWYEDGSFWGAYLMGYKGPMDHFEFAVTAGNLPPTCVIFGGSVEQEVWGLSVTADKYDGEDGCSRRVSFMKDEYGYRFDLTATGEPEDAEKLVSRAVTWVARGGGLNLYTMTGEEPPAAPRQTPSRQNSPRQNPPRQNQHGTKRTGPAPPPCRPPSRRTVECPCSSERPSPAGEGRCSVTAPECRTEALPPPPG